MMEEANRPRLMLLTGARSYRAGAFHQAAEQLGIDVTPVVNMSRELAEHWEAVPESSFVTVANGETTIVPFAPQPR